MTRATTRAAETVVARSGDSIVSPVVLVAPLPRAAAALSSGLGAGNVRINWRAIQVAPRLVDYVLAHELAHLEHRRHDVDFWARLGEVMHDADARRAALRRAGARVSW